MTTLNCLFRKSSDTINEFNICRKYIDTYENRMELPKNSTIVGRYSVLPFYKELENDLKINNSKLINSFSEHEFISKFDWYWELEDIQKHTFETFREHDLPYLPEGQYIVKGCTNSKKNKWNTHMYCSKKSDIVNTILALKDDSLIESQDIIIRKYEPLKTFEVGINGQPFTNEWRFFYYKSFMLSHGYYWTNLNPELLTLPYITNDAISLANNIAMEVSKFTNFFVLDLAETKEGSWKLVEINDGQMSGLSFNDPDTLYSNLSKNLNVKGLG